MNPEIATSRLFLRILNTDSSQAILSFLKDNKDFFEPFEPAKNKDFYTLDQQESIIKREYLSALGQTFFRFYIFEKSNPNMIIGTISLAQILPFPYCSCVLGYKFDPNFQKKGYATESLDAIISFAFNKLKIHRIQVFIMENNLSSLRLIHRLGFKKEGLDINSINIQGLWKTHLRYALINPLS